MKKISIKIWLPILIIISIAVSLAIYFSLPKEGKLIEITISKKETPEIPTEWKIWASFRPISTLLNG